MFRIYFLNAGGGKEMANCGDMKEGDLIVCESCGLELKVAKTCSCGSGGEKDCEVPLQCCGKSMVKK